MQLRLPSKKASVSASKASVSIGAIAPPPANRRVSGSHPIAARKACAIYISSLCCPSLRSGRSAAGAGERGGFSPHPATNGGTRISTPFGPSQRSAPLRCAALALLRSNAPHRSPSLHAAHRLRRLTGRLLPAILLRRCLPSRNTCKLYVAHGNMVIDHITKATSLPCAGLLCRTRRQRICTGGSGPDAGIACAIRTDPPSFACCKRSASCPGPPGRFKSVLACTATEAARLPLAQAKGGVAAIGNG